MNGNSFVDTNILVYARDSTEPGKQRIAEELLRRLWEERSGRISCQVCSEYYVTVTQKLDPGLSREEAWEDVRDLSAWRPSAIDMTTLYRAREIQDEYGLSWWDSQIIASAYLLECERIYSEDFGHGRKYRGIEVIDPFAG